MSCWRRFNMPFRLSSAHPTEERQSELIASSPFHGRQKSLFPCRWNVGESSLRGEHEYPLSVAWNGNDVGNPHSGTCDSERFGWSVGFAGPSSKRSGGCSGIFFADNVGLRHPVNGSWPSRMRTWTSRRPICIRTSVPCSYAKFSWETSANADTTSAASPRASILSTIPSCIQVPLDLAVLIWWSCSL